MRSLRIVKQHRKPIKPCPCQNRLAKPAKQEIRNKSKSLNLFRESIWKMSLEISNVQLYVGFSWDPKSDNHSIFVWPFMIKGMGGRVYVSVLPWTIFVPTQTLSHPKLSRGVERNSPAGKHFHHVLIIIYQLLKCCQNGLWKKKRINPPLVTGSNIEVWPPTIAKQRRKKVSGRVHFRCHSVSCAVSDVTVSAVFLFWVSFCWFDVGVLFVTA